MKLKLAVREVAQRIDFESFYWNNAQPFDNTLLQRNRDSVATIRLEIGYLRFRLDRHFERR